MTMALQSRRGLWAGGGLQGVACREQGSAEKHDVFHQELARR